MRQKVAEKRRKQETAEKRIRRLVEAWFIKEPLFFDVWNLHILQENPETQTLRTGKGKIEYNPSFVQSLEDSALRKILFWEAMRITLKHPYSRKKEVASIAYLASNVTLQEYISSSFPTPYAFDLLETHQFDRQYFELYYEKFLPQLEKLMEQQVQSPPAPQSSMNTAPKKPDDPADSNSQTLQKSGGQEPDEEEVGAEETESQDLDAQTGDSQQASLSHHFDSFELGAVNTEPWDRDELQSFEINEKIVQAQQSNQWGSLSGELKELILATLKPKVNYRKMLREFRTSILSNQRRLTRMKPSRRYDFWNMGSRHEFSTKLLVAIDVSGSMSTEDLQQGFSIINQLFRYGIESIKVLQFDIQIQGTPIEFKKARKEVKIKGRGGTSFEKVLQLIEKDRSYDGLIIFTDGYANRPQTPRNHHTKVFWLFNSEENYKAMKRNVAHIGKCAFLKEGN